MMNQHFWLVNTLLGSTQNKVKGLRVESSPWTPLKTIRGAKKYENDEERNGSASIDRVQKEEKYDE